MSDERPKQNKMHYGHNHEHLSYKRRGLLGHARTTAEPAHWWYRERRPYIRRK